MTAFIGKPIFSGSWEEDLDNCISIFYTFANMCEITDEDKLRAVTLILRGDALNYFANNSSSCTKFDEAMSTIRSWYNNEDRKARILSKW